MGWENQDPSDKNLQALRNEFSLENIRGANVLDAIPDVTEIGEAEFRQVNLSGTIYLYTKISGTLYRIPWTAA